jgi:hypothetical protein
MISTSQKNQLIEYLKAQGVEADFDSYGPEDFSLELHHLEVKKVDLPSPIDRIWTRITEDLHAKDSLYSS